MPCFASAPGSRRSAAQSFRGPRSQSAADHFRLQGYTDVHNLMGGIDAWSREIDPDVPRY